MDHDPKFEAFYALHYPTVLGVARGRTDETSARDAVAEVFLVAWRRRDLQPDNEVAWLLGILRKVLANQRRSARRGAALVSRLEEILTADSAAHAESAPADAVTVALAALADRDRRALTLVYWNDLDNAAAAAIEGCSVRTFAVRLHRARRRLRAVLEQTSAAAPTHPDRPIGADHAPSE